MRSSLVFLLSGSVALAASVTSPLIKRAECGSGIGSCPAGECCSEGGWCGTSREHCGGSQCQLEYSDSCDTFSPPAGKSTEGMPRPHVGDVPYGKPITECVKPGLMALTFDDGPYNYTNEILDILEDLGVVATFFVAGNNKGKRPMDEPDTPWPSIMKRMKDAGHHIASHSWTHRNLNEVNNTIQRSEIVYNEMSFRNLFGWIPTYFRAPYLECNSQSGCLDNMDDLGYHLIDISVDTKDYEYDSPEQIHKAKERFSQSVSEDPTKKGHIVLAHDVHLQTVTNLTEYMVRTSLDRGYKLVTVGECLGDDEENWYRKFDEDNHTKLPSSAVPTNSDDSCSLTPVPSSGASATSSEASEPTGDLKVSPDQTCGGTTGYICRGSAYGDCCSWYGFCGSDASYCGTGCDPAFGDCTKPATGTTDTTNGLCGKDFDATCANYGEKTCCSKYGYCGNAKTHCGAGCQSEFGICD